MFAIKHCMLSCMVLHLMLMSIYACDRQHLFIKQSVDAHERALHALLKDLTRNKTLCSRDVRVHYSSNIQKILAGKP